MRTLTGLTMEMAYQAMQRPYPPEALSRRGGAANLVGVETSYVIERLNEVFGLIGYGWFFDILEQPTPKDGGTQLVCQVGLQYVIDTEQPPGPTSGRIISHRITAHGHQAQNKGMPPGDAAKGCISDALKKCASYLGSGIDLYRNLQTMEDPNMGEEFVKHARELTKSLPAGTVVNIMARVGLEKGTMKNATLDQQTTFFALVDDELRRTS